MAKSRKHQQEQVDEAVEQEQVDTGAEADTAESEQQDTETSEEPTAPSDIDRQELGTLLRQGQRFAQHVRTKVAFPELQQWAQDAQHFINKYGL